MNKILKFSGIIFVILVFFAGCDLFKSDPEPVSIDQRIASFVADCNSSDKSDMYLNLHPTATISRDAHIASSTWTEFSDTYKPWIISVPNRTGTTEVTATGTIDNNTITIPEAITIVFKESEANVWYIKSLSWEGIDPNIF
jgi:hypothetical protein